MPPTIIAFVWRKPGTTPAEFKSHYESTHVPLVRSLAGPHFSTTHTRHYIQRFEANDVSAASTDDNENAMYPATVLIGEQADFDYDAYAELVFEDQGHFKAFMDVMTTQEVQEKLAEDEAKFMDWGKMRVVVVDESVVTTGAKA